MGEGEYVSGCHTGEQNEGKLLVRQITSFTKHELYKETSSQISAMELGLDCRHCNY